MKGHSSVITSVCFSPDNTKIVTGSWDTKIMIWDSKSIAKLGAPLKGHSDSIICVKFSPDGTRLVSGSSD